jgi:hypothetical protein
VEHPACPGFGVRVRADPVPVLPGSNEGLLCQVAGFLAISAPEILEADKLLAVRLEEAPEFPFVVFPPGQSRSPLVRSHRDNARRDDLAAKSARLTRIRLVRDGDYPATRARRTKVSSPV